MAKNYIPKIPEWFETRKAAQVTAYFGIRSGGKINILKATKLVYLADRASMEARDVPITGDNFVSMPFGPVNTYTYSYMDGKAVTRMEAWRDFIGKRKVHDLPVVKGVTLDDLDELSPFDIEILAKTWTKFKDIDRFELADWTHKFCPEWRNPHGSSIPIEFATVFDRLGKETPVELAEGIQAEREFLASLRSDG